jgi:hypothetical protein
MPRASSVSKRTHRPRGVRRTLESDRRKGPNALVCACGLFHHRGAWHLGPPPLVELREATCPSCKRIRRGRPGGTLKIPPRFLGSLREIVNLIYNCERRERAEHPLERLVNIRDESGGLRVTTTGVHLARRIARSLAHRFHEKPRMRFGAGKDELVVDWESPAA